jgi:hypothetical protein
MTDLNLAALEAYLAEHYGDWGQEQGLFIKLVEEMGEIAELLNIRAGRKQGKGQDTDQELVTELADLIHYAVAIAAINGLDLSKAIIEKDIKAAIKYQHDRNLADFLAEWKQRP